jgi:hypothetical protein
MFGFSTMPSKATRAAWQSVGSVHEHFRLDDGHDSGFLAQCRVTSQSSGIGVDRIAARNCGSDIDHGAPFGESCTQFVILGQPLAQSVQTLGDGLIGKAGQRLRAQVHFDAGKHAKFGKIRRERYTRLGFLPQGFIVHDDAADVFLRPRSAEQHLAIRTPILFRGVQFDAVKAFFDGAGTLVRSQNSSVFRNQRTRCGVKLSDIHGWTVSLKLLGNFAQG